MAQHDYHQSMTEPSMTEPSMTEPSMTEPILIATAGHVDHGKSTLVKALTGTDPDRWQEEKQRGITIDLGYAHLTHGVRTYSFVDVPGHEKFIHNMLAGIGSIDAVLFVIAADESIMPQTREHARALSFLGVEQVCVVLSKIDLVDEELVELLSEEVEEWLAEFGWDHAPRLHFSAKQPETREHVLAQLAKLKKKEPPLTSGFRLSVDRVFTSPGSGTVLTGTVERGTLEQDAPVFIQPLAAEGRIRQLQVHGRQVDRVGPHTRTAINLSDIHYSRIHRGFQIFGNVKPETCRKILVRLSHFEESWEPGPRHWFHVHHLAAKLLARLIWRHEGFALLELKERHAFWALDRGLIRDGSPLRVLAGFEVLDPFPRRLKWRQLKEALAQAPESRLAAWQDWYVDVTPGLMEVAAVALRCGEPLQEGPRGRVVVVRDKFMIKADTWDLYNRDFIEGLKLCHRKHPLFAWVSLNQVLSMFRERKWPAEIVKELLASASADGRVLQSGDRVKFGRHRVIWREADFERLSALLAPLKKPMAIIDFKGRKEDVQANAALVDLLLWEKYVVALTPDLLIHFAFLNRIMARLHDSYQGRCFSIQELKTDFGFSRKYAIPLLEYLDKMGFTRREAEGRTWIAQTKPQLQSNWEPPQKSG